MRYYSFIIIVIALIPGFVFSATAPTNLISTPQEVTDLFCGALKWMFWGLIVVSVIMFIVGGYLYATSAGDAERVTKATKTITFAAIAVVIALIALGAPVLIGSFFGVPAGQLNAC